ncbi:PepSY-associated TM helix domain-containing protein [Reichenbachiella ulvae]|uniref:PepSY domain-containing protein n=1 Tax=Reichenbachiella ulvae TaxID=2980104 RepID=A0ABT3CQY3_9BACT|nr:PepSY-associated TM helix domain-containing protein [Reichenbachiella ulvae]MCV9386126.1 PepSY domain-containing protein [Reichenbachiella ulvae]
MDNRKYNVLFHLHTISGIVISALLFVIFFAGSFSFFRDEIVNWQKGHTVAQTEAIDMDLDLALDSLALRYDLKGRNLSIGKHYRERRIGVNLEASNDSTAADEAKKGSFFYLDTETQESTSYADSYSLGEFLYRLHFFAQIPHPFGYHLSGFTALFFLFALITGVLVHWDKIISNFFLFRPWAKLKTMWTDGHTVLGTIGLPFQFVYAVTGAFFMIKAVLIAPSVFVLYDGDQKKLFDDLGYGEPHYEYAYQDLESDFHLNQLVAATEADWPGFEFNHLHIFNYGDQNMHVSIEGQMNWNQQFTGPGKRIYKVATGEIVEEQSPMAAASYLEGVKNSLYRLHFGDYGGYPLRIISFLLGIVSCFVILSGVMIWLVARDKKKTPERRRRFNLWVAQVYMAVCLSMFPVTALSFHFVQIFGGGIDTIYTFYFIPWLILSAFFIIKRDIAFTNKYCLLSGSLIGFLIPMTNGIVSGNWIWIAFENGMNQVLFIDLFWLGLSVLAFYSYWKIRSDHIVAEIDIKEIIETPDKKSLLVEEMV